MVELTGRFIQWVLHWWGTVVLIDKEVYWQNIKWGENSYKRNDLIFILKIIVDTFGHGCLLHNPLFGITPPIITTKKGDFVAILITTWFWLIDVRNQLIACISRTRELEVRDTNHAHMIVDVWTEGCYQIRTGVAIFIPCKQREPHLWKRKEQRMGVMWDSDG